MQVPGLHEKLTVSGPYIVLLGYEPQQSIWRASVMIVTPPPQGAILPAEPTLSFSDQGAVLDATVQNFVAAEVNTIESPLMIKNPVCCLSRFYPLSCASCPVPS
jgi:hypothetical protein